MKPKSTLRAFLAFAGSTLLTISYTSATPYYWDGNDDTAGFQNASPGPTGTWSSSTPSTATGGFTTDSTGSTAISSNPAVGTTTADDIFFGTGNLTATPPLYPFTGVITIDGTVNAKSVYLSENSAAILVINTPAINFAAEGTFEHATTSTATLPTGLAITGASTSMTWKVGFSNNLNIGGITSNGAANNILTGPGRIVVNNTLNLGAAGRPVVFDGGVLRMITGITWTKMSELNAEHPVSFTPNKDLGIDRRHAFSFEIDNPLNLGTGGLSIEGTTTGDVILSQDYQYSGPTTLSGGSTSVQTTGNLGLPASNLVFNGGILKIRGTTLTNFSTIGHTVVFTDTKPVALNIDDAGHTFTVDQALNQGTGGFTKSGAGTVVVNHATSTYTGATTVTAGTLQATNSALSGATTVSGGTMGLGGTNTFSGLITVSSAGTLTLSGDNSAANGGVTLNGATAILNLNSATALGTGTCTLTAGTLKNSVTTLSTTHPVVFGGNFAWEGVNNLTFGSGAITNAGNRTITLNGTGSILTFGGSMASTANAVQTTTVNGAGNTLVLGGYILQNLNTTDRINVINGSGNVTITGAVTNGLTAASGLSYTGTGTLTLNGNNTYDGLTLVNNASGTVTLIGDNTDATGGVTLTNGTLNVNSATALGTGTVILTAGTINNTSGIAKILATNNLVTFNGNFAFGGSNNLTFGNGDITNGASRTFTLNGTGSTLAFGGKMINTLANNQTTTVNGVGNILSLGGYALSNSAIIRTGIISGSGNVTITGAVTGSSLSGSESIASLLTYSGSGTLTLKGINTYTGNTAVNSGATLALVGGSQDSAITVNSSAFLGFTLGQPTTSTKAVNLTNGTVTISNPGAVDNSSDYLLMTAAGGFTFTDPLTQLGTVITDYELQLKNGNTELWLVHSVGGTPFQDWALAKGLDGTVGKENGKTDDPDGDGKNNNFEFAFNGNPLSGSDNGMMAGLVQDASAPAGNELTLIVAVRDGATFGNAGSPVVQTATVDEVTYTIEGTLDLVTIPGSDVSHAAGPANTAPLATGLPDLTGTAWEYHTFKLDASEGLGSKGFLRAKAE